MVKRVGRPRSLEKVGRVFGRLTITAPVYKDGAPAWECLCACGTQHVVKDADIRNTKSCGCLRVDKGKARATHGRTKTKTYEVWHAMKQRCLNPKNRAWVNYGGRGIAVCPAWVASFETFLADMGERPAGYSLERIDNNKGYSPDNCVWASAREQANNRRSNALFEVGGVQMTLTELSALAGLSIQTLSWRIYRLGMTASEAVNTPRMRKRKEVQDGGDTGGEG
jgi:hypothetical protein